MSRSRSARASSFLTHSSLLSNTTPPVTDLLIRRYGRPAFVSMMPLFACVMMSAYASISQKDSYRNRCNSGNAGIVFPPIAHPSLAWKMSLLKMQMRQLLHTSLRHSSGGSPCSPANHPKAIAGLKRWTHPCRISQGITRIHFLRLHVHFCSCDILKRRICIFRTR